MELNYLHISADKVLKLEQNESTKEIWIERDLHDKSIWLSCMKRIKIKKMLNERNGKF